MNKKYIILGVYSLILMTAITSVLFRSSYAIENNYTPPTNELKSNLNTTSRLNYVADALSGNTTYNDFINNFKTPSNYKSSTNDIAMYSIMKNMEFATVNEKMEVIDSDNPTVINDKGLEYIISHGYNTINNINTVFTSNKYGETDDNQKQYITQIAIWLYSFEKKDSLSYCSLETKTDGISACDFYNTSSNTLTTISSMRGMINQASNNNSYKYLSYILELVDKAKAYTSETSTMNTINQSNITYTFYKDHIISNKINPSASSDTANYLDFSVTITDPNNYGVYLINDSNVKITNTNNLTEGFRIYVPLKSDVTSMDLSSIQININGFFIVETQLSNYRVTSTTDTLLENKKQKYANDIIAHFKTKTVSTNFSLRNYTMISKVDATSKEEIPGATLVIQDKTSKAEIDKWVSTTTPHYVYLDSGSYILCETIPPEKYVLNTECIEFQVTDNRVVSKTMENELMEIPDTSAFKDYRIVIIALMIIGLGISVAIYATKTKENY